MDGKWSAGNRKGNSTKFGTQEIGRIRPDDICHCLGLLSYLTLETYNFLLMSKKLLVFGVGSSLDKDFMNAIEAAVSELNITVDLKTFSDIQSFLRYKISAIPALIVGDKIVVHGRVPSITELKDYLTSGSEVTN